jgi:hypothetical protein
VVFSNLNSFRLELVRVSVDRGSIEIMVGLFREKDSSFGHADRSALRSDADALILQKIKDERQAHL